MRKSSSRRSIIADLFCFFQVAVSRWPVTRTWVPAVLVPPAGRPWTRGVRRRRHTEPRTWWCFPVTVAAPFEIIWDARPCYPSGCAVSGKERAGPWRNRMRRILYGREVLARRWKAAVQRAIVLFQSVRSYTEQFFFFFFPLNFRWHTRSEIDTNISETRNELWMRDVNEPGMLRKGGVHAVNPIATFPRGRMGPTDVMLLFFFLCAIFPRESLAFCHFLCSLR